MALAPVVAAALNVGLPTRTKMLTVGGTDYIRQPGTSGNAYGIPIESVQLSEAGPGDISSLTFTIQDPLGVITVAQYQTVIFWDITRDVALFSGWVDTWSTTSFGIGRQMAVTCIGIEAALDWMYVPTQTFAPGGNVPFNDMLQQVCAAALGIGVPLNLASSIVSSTIDHPVYGAALQLGTPSLVWGGGTLRQALQAVCDMFVQAWSSPASGFYFAVTVDFYGGLRVWPQLPFQFTFSPQAPADYTPLALSTGGANKPGNTQALTTASEATAVYVVGGNASGTGIFSIGGIGPTKVVTDSNSLSAVYAAALAASYLARYGASTQGSVEAQEVANVGTSAAQVRAGSLLNITDSEVGVPASTYSIARIEKTFNPSGTENWTVDFGSMVRLGSTELRRLTRTVLS